MAGLPLHSFEIGGEHYGMHFDEYPEGEIDEKSVTVARVVGGHERFVHDAGFKRAFARHCRHHKIKAEVVSRTTAHTFEVLPRRWVVERTWAWLVNHRRLRIDYERDPAVTEGFVWAAHARLLLRASPPSPPAEPRWEQIRDSY